MSFIFQIQFVFVFILCERIIINRERVYTTGNNSVTFYHLFLFCIAMEIRILGRETVLEDAINAENSVY